MPDDYTSEILWGSNGKWTGQDDVINEMSKGYGFAFFSGHGSPRTWGNQYPGIPGNRIIGSIKGLAAIAFILPLSKLKPPFFPMNKLTNDYKNPIVLVGGCHNSDFNVSTISSLLGYKEPWCGYAPVPECWSEWIINLPKTGSIATIGNTGMGFGALGEWANFGPDNWITTEFFRQYGTEGKDILGETYAQTLMSYREEFGTRDDGDLQTLQQWVLFGDPSLLIGGYS